MVSRSPFPRAKLTRLLTLPEASQARAAERAVAVATEERAAAEVTAEAAIAVVAVAATAETAETVASEDHPDLLERRARVARAAPSADPDLLERRARVARAALSADPDLLEKTAAKVDPEPLAAIREREEAEAEVASSVVDSEAAARAVTSLLPKAAEEKSEPAEVKADSEVASVEVEVDSEVTEDLMAAILDRMVAVPLETMMVTTPEAEVVREELALVVALVAATPLLSEYDDFSLAA